MRVTLYSVMALVFCLAVATSSWAQVTKTQDAVKLNKAEIIAKKEQARQARLERRRLVKERKLRVTTAAELRAQIVEMAATRPDPEKEAKLAGLKDRGLEKKEILDRVNSLPPNKRLAALREELKRIKKHPEAQK